MALDAICSSSSRPLFAGRPLRELMISEIRIAAGAPSTEAMMKCAVGIRDDGTEDGGVEYQHRPRDAGHAARHHNEYSLRVSRSRYGRIISGDSTMPRKMLAAVESPTAPPTPIVFSSAQPKARTIGGRMR